MAGTVDVGTGTTATWGTSGFSAELLDVALNDLMARQVINTHHMGTTGAITKRTTDLYDPGSLTIQIHLDPDDPTTSAPFNGAEETFTLTFPVPSGKSSGASLAGTAATTNLSGRVALEDKMTATLTVMFLDDLTWTDSAT